jgi:hypothetical protein
MIKDHSRFGQPDDLNAVIGDPHYTLNWYPKGLREALNGPHSLTNVGVTRYYPGPGVVVDFEPITFDFRVEERRAYFHTQGLVYVPIFRREVLTRAQFSERLEQERAALDQATVQNTPLDVPPDLEEALRDASVVAAIRMSAHQAIQARIETTGTPLRGIALKRALETEQARLLQELRERMRDGSLGVSASPQ